jgi:hypothetical protein
LMWFNADSTRVRLQELNDLERIKAWTAAGVPTAFEDRARALAASASHSADARRSVLSREIAAIAANEVAMAQRQLRLIRVGIARMTDGAVQHPVAGPTP